jgi:hypothetical protein
MIDNTAFKLPPIYLSTASPTQPEGLRVIQLVLDDPTVALSAVRQRIGRLNWLTANWDGYGSAKPDSNAVEATRSMMSDLYHGAALTQYEWFDPHVSANESGDVVLEWWHDTKKVTLYVTPIEATYVRIWGDNMETEMDEGNLTARPEFERIWSWLHT